MRGRRFPLIKRLKLREPFNGLSHLAGAGLSLAGLLLLVSMSQGKPWHLTGFAVYGVCMMLLYIASALYHLLPVEPRRVEQLLMWDQVGIYLLIAGTYTPVCLVSLRGPWGWGLLAVVWTIALVGIALRIGWKGAPPWLCIAMYVVLGWLCVVALPDLQRVLSPAGLLWLFAGGMLYTVGSIVWAMKWPRLWPGKFESHELWHLFVLGGSACHFMMMLWFVLPSG